MRRASSRLSRGLLVVMAPDSSGELERVFVVLRSLACDADTSPMFPELSDPAWLHAQYVSAGRTGSDIAAELGCTSSAVYEALVRHRIQSRPPGLPSNCPQPDDRAWLRR
jgi:hypothetical protein